MLGSREVGVLAMNRARMGSLAGAPTFQCPHAHCCSAQGSVSRSAGQPQLPRHLVQTLNPALSTEVSGQIQA